MLVEPEVLHMIVEYSDYFRKLHECYADSHGHMELGCLIQFCTDFGLSPQFASCDFLRASYDSSLNVETAETDRGCATRSESANSEVKVPSAQSRLKVDESVREKSVRPRRASINPSSNTRVWFIQRSEIDHGPPANEKTAADNPPAVEPSSDSVADAGVTKSHSTVEEGKGKASLAVVFGVSAFMEIMCKIAFVHLGFYGNSVQQSSSAYARLVWLITYLCSVSDHLTRGLRRLEAGANTRQLETDKIRPSWLRAVTAIQPETTSHDQEGSDAASSGNTLRARHTLIHPHLGVGNKSIARRKIQSDLEGSKRKVLTKTLTKTLRLKIQVARLLHVRSEPEGDAVEDGASDSSSDADLHDEAPLPLQSSVDLELMKKVPKAFSKASTRVGDEMLQEDDAGQPCIRDGRCAICDRLEAASVWGYPRCRGCSIVDAMPLASHPFRRLLVGDGGGRLQMPVALPKLVQTRPATVKNDARPQPMQRLHDFVVRPDVTPPPETPVEGRLREHFMRMDRFTDRKASLHRADRESNISEETASPGASDDWPK
eukprot:TRINITY_DN33347_c0_g1_i2.p1 TRINITY_DN33347_c0_g1~~TRINITY_DN33347_c0_g1_i2.p1  ORF type:complete len:628 (-),score=102.24 TRINITY_DN33347_c0_g1_i2:12-1646(-)